MTEIDGAGPIWYNLQDVGNARGKFIHPPQEIHDAPAVYSLDGPVGGTVPTWYDPSYWIEGATPRVALRRQAVMFFTNSGDCFDLIFSHEAALLAVLVTICCLGAGATLRRLLSAWPVWVPAIAALGGYLIVVVQPRYAAAFLTVLWLALFSAVRLRSEGDGWKIPAGAVLALMVALGAPMLLSAAKDFDGSVLHRHEHTRWETAVQLHRMGVQPGDRVGWIGNLHDIESARLLHLRIVGEVPRFQATDFWNSSSGVQSQVIDSFRKIGATAIIAEQVPPTQLFPPTLSWEKIGDSDFWVHVMKPPAQAPK